MQTTVWVVRCVETKNQISKNSNIHQYNRKLSTIHHEHNVRNKVFHKRKRTENNVSEKF